MNDPCANCGEPIDGYSHLVECFETIGEFFCRECWEENLEAAAAYEAEDAR